MKKNRQKEPSEGNNHPDLRLAVLIIAHNEEAVIVPLVHSLNRSLTSGDRVYVIADNCTDRTAELAEGVGALVRKRTTGGPQGKGAALQWLIGQEAGLSLDFDLLAILDADSRVPEDFLPSVKTAYRPGTVIQCLVQPIDYESSPISTLSALSEILEQNTFDRIRIRLGWPVRLKGTGMLIPPGILVQYANRIHTEVEDIALSLLFASAGIPIQASSLARVYDPKPLSTILASRQRARWFRGQLAAFWHYRMEVIRLFTRGPAGWSLLDSLFLRPLWLRDGILLGCSVLVYFLSPVLAFILGAILFWDIFCTVYTITRLPRKKIFIKAILHFPVFILMWLHGILLAMQKSPWRRARE